MAGVWSIFVQDRPWDGSRKLFMRVNDPRTRESSFVTGLTVETVPFGATHDKPTLAETWEDEQDRVGDVTGFLQAALDAAWNLGMRPKGFADHTNEIAAVRYHLEDMRALAKVPERRK